MKWMKWMGRFFGLVPDFTADDILNAEQEDALREHGAALQAVQAKSAERRLGNSRLRAALDEAKSALAIPALSDFEHALHHHKERPGSVRNPD